jgi:hypothetical protein
VHALALLPWVSLVNMYSVIPLPSTRIDPRPVVATPKARVAASALAGAGAEDAGALEDMGAELAAVVDAG